VFGWPEPAWRGCSLSADQLAHLNARDTTLAYASGARQRRIERLKIRVGWKMPRYTMTDSFDKDFGVDEGHDAQSNHPGKSLAKSMPTRACNSMKGPLLSCTADAGVLSRDTLRRKLITWQSI
jgi:predicted dithiol-disulfide oxidoreductase (DUF899 family)